MRFGPAIDELTCTGRAIRRQCWPEDSYVGFHMATSIGPYFYIVEKYEDTEVRVPWFPCVYDMTAHDWAVNED